MQPQQGPEGAMQIDVRYWLHSLWGGKWIILVCMLLASALAFVQVHLQQVSYRSQAQIQIDAPPYLPTPGADLNAQTSYYSNIDRYFKTERQKLTSRRLHLLFAERLKAKEKRYQHVPTDQIASEFGGGLSLTPVEDTN